MPQPSAARAPSTATRPASRTPAVVLGLVVWNRVSGSLEVEFDPEPLQRIAVGDEVWIDLNPAPAPHDAPPGGR